MADGRDPGRTVDVEAAVVVAGEVGLARVQAHPDADRGAIRPRVPGQGALGRRRAARRRPGLAERREHRIALGPDDTPPCALDGARG